MKILKNNFLLLILGVHLFFILTTKFTAWPEMTFWPYLITKGWLPYRDIAIAHTPLLIVVLSTVYKFFGVGILQLQIFTWLLILFTDALLFWVVKKLWNTKTANLSLISYIFLQLFYEGNGLWFELAFTPFILILYYLLKNKKYLLAGIVWGMSLLIKQTAFWFIFPILLTVFASREDSISIKVRKFEKFVIGTTITFGIFYLLLELAGIHEDFRYWAFDFGILYLPQASGQIQIPTLKQFFVYFFPFAPILFVPELIPWTIAGLMGVYPRFGLFHFQPALPFLSICLALVLIRFRYKARLIVLLYILLVLFMFLKYLGRDFNKETRFYENDVKKVVSVVNSQSNKGEDLYVLNYWDNVYAFTNTLPVTRPWYPYLDWYLELPGVRSEILEDISNHMPSFIVIAIQPPYNWEEMDDILKYYSCTKVDEKIELCQKNN